MPRALPVDLRQRIFALAQRGLRAADLARLFPVPERTLRHLLQDFRHAADDPPLLPRYAACGRPRADAQEGLRSQCLTLRREHRGWGAERLRLELHHLNPGVPLPSTRTLQLWLAAAGLNPLRPQLPRLRAVGRATAEHQVWQMDAAERLRLSSGQEVSWLRIVDEYTGAVLATVLFPPRALAAGAGAGDPGGAAARLRPLGPAVVHSRG